MKKSSNVSALIGSTLLIQWTLKKLNKFYQPHPVLASCKLVLQKTIELLEVLSEALGSANLQMDEKLRISFSMCLSGLPNSLKSFRVKAMTIEARTRI